MKKMTLDKAAGKLTDIISEHLVTLPLKERKKRTEKAYKIVKTYVKSSDMT